MPVLWFEPTVPVAEVSMGRLPIWILDTAAAELEASVHDLELVDGKVTVRGMPDKGITLASIGKKGNLYMSKTPPVLGKANPAFTQQAPGFAAQLARLELDPDTGEVLSFARGGDARVWTTKGAVDLDVSDGVQSQRVRRAINRP